MDIQQLKYFLAVIDNGSYQRAADALGVTQSALTKSVSRLEVFLGVTLLNRGHHGSTATTFGAAFALRARAICSEEVAARTELADLLHGDHGHVRLGMGIAFANGIIPRVIREFRQYYKRATITVREGMSPDLFDALRRGDIDFVISSPLDRPATMALEFDQTFLFEDSDDIVAAQSHPLAGREDIHFESLREYPWVITNSVPVLRHLLWRTFRDHGVAPPDHVILTDSVELAKKLVAEQSYLVLLGREFIRHEEKLGLLCALSVDSFKPTRSTFLTMRRGSVINSASTAFVDLLLKATATDIP